MSAGARRAALAAALLVCLPASAVPARADDERPVVQLAQATPGDEPQLSDEPPTSLDGSSTATGGGADGSDGAPEASTGGGLPDTGSDAGLVGLAGISLLGMGLAMRVRLREPC